MEVSVDIDRTVAETLSPIERAILAIVYSLKPKRVGIQSSEVYKILNEYLTTIKGDKISVDSFNTLLKRLNTAGIIKLTTNRKATNPVDYYRIYKKYPETILDAILEVDEDLKRILEFCS